MKRCSVRGTRNVPISQISVCGTTGSQLSTESMRNADQVAEARTTAPTSANATRSKRALATRRVVVLIR